MTEKRKPRGFAAMDPAMRDKIASMGGTAAHRSGNGRVFNSESARAAAYKRHELRKQGTAGSSVVSAQYGNGSDG